MQKADIEKAHPTKEFVVMAYNEGCTLLFLASSLGTVVKQVVRQAD